MIIDASERERAIDPRSSFTVTAPAGSGKTELLTQRYLSLLAVVDQPESILAITFTRKAVAEMRARIMTALIDAQAYDGALAQLPDHRKNTLKLAKAALKADRQRDWGLLDNPARMRVYTFDAFSASLVRQMPINSRFGGAASPAEHPEQYYQHAVERVLKHLDSSSEHATSIEQLLLHMNVRVNHVATLLSSMLAKRDQWRGLFASMHGNPQHAVNILHQWFCEQVEFTLHRVHELLSPFENELCQLINFADAQLREHGEPALRAVNAEVMHALPQPVVRQLQLWRVITRFLMTKQGGLRATVNIKQGFPPKKSKPQYTVDDFKALMQGIAEQDDARAVLAELHILPDPADIKRHEPVLRSLMDVLHLAMAYLELEFQQHQQVDFVATSLQALEALSDNSELAMKLDYSIQHILVDEFQDTSQLQYDLLERICQEWSATETPGRSLFLVGDAMQSIYSFRNARVALFMHARRYGLAGVDCDSLELKSNFRSEVPIIDWLNHCFAQVFPDKDDLRHNASAYVATSCTKTVSEQSSEVLAFEFAIDQDPERQLEAQQIASKLKALQTTYPADSIAILVRNRRHAIHLLPVLQAHGLNVVFNDFERFIDKAVVADVLNLTRLVLNPADQLAWYALLRSPLMGISLTDLLTISEYSRYDVYFAIKQVLAKDAAISDAAKQCLRGFVQAFDVLVQQRQRKPLVNDIDGLWSYLGGHLFYSDYQSQAAFRKYQAELLALCSSAGDPQWEQIEAHMSQLSMSTDASSTASSVELMTMHKAKGLEFDSVFLPALDLGVKGEGAELLSWSEQFVSPSESTLLLGIPEKGKQATPGTYDYVRAQNRAQSNHEAARLLYVACSRARKRLYLFRGYDSAKPDQHASMSLASLLWPRLPDAPISIERSQTLEATSEYEPHALPPSSTNIRRKLNLASVIELQKNLNTTAPLIDDQADQSIDVNDWFTAPDAETTHLFKRCVGIVVHRNLQYWADNGGAKCWQLSAHDGRTRIKTQLLANGLRSELEKATDWVFKALTAASTDNKNQWVLEGGRAEVEYRLSESSAVRSVVLDRLVQDSQGALWIVDYKTHLDVSATDGELRELAGNYRPQLQTYQQAIAEPTRLAVYFVLQQAFIELT